MPSLREGWRELAEKIDAVCDKLPDKDHIFILCDNYGQAGAINYYSKNKNIKAVSFSADYINWFKLDTKIEHFIRVKESKGKANELAETSPFFDIGFAADSVTNPYVRTQGTTIFVFSKPKIDVNLRLKNELDNKKKGD